METMIFEGNIDKINSEIDKLRGNVDFSNKKLILNLTEKTSPSKRINLSDLGSIGHVCVQLKK